MFNRVGCASLIGSLVLCAGSLAVAADVNWRTSLDVTTKFVNWQWGADTRKFGDYTINGSQVWTPVTYSIMGQSQDFTLTTSLRGGYIFADQDNKDNVANFLYRGSVHDFTDTSVQAQLQYTKSKDFVPYLMIGLNVPTGHSSLRYVDGDCCNGDGVWTGEQFSVSNSNTIELMSTYGEGFNSQVGTGFSKKLSRNLSLALGATYTWKGAYQSTYAIDLGRAATVNPGDQLSLSSNLQYTADGTQYLLGLGYKIESGSSAVTISGDNTTYRHGDTMTLDASAVHEWNDKFRTDAIFNYSHILDNAFSRPGVSGLSPNFDRFQFEVDNTYRVSAPFSIYSKSSLSDTINPGVNFIDGLFMKGLNEYTIKGELGTQYIIPDGPTAKLGGGAFIDKVLETDTRDAVHATGWFGSASLVWEW